MERLSALVFGRMAAKHDSKKTVNSISEVRSEGNLRPGGHCPGLFHDEGRIEGEERLLRHGCTRAPLNALVGHRKIERAKKRRQILPIHQSVEGAAAIKRIAGKINWPSAEGRVQATSDKKQGVTHGFEIQSAAREMPKQFVLRIRRGR